MTSQPSQSALDAETEAREPLPTTTIADRWVYQPTVLTARSGDFFPATLRWDREDPHHGPALATEVEVALLAEIDRLRSLPLDVDRLWGFLEGVGVIDNGTWVSFRREDAEMIAARCGRRGLHVHC